MTGRAYQEIGGDGMKKLLVDISTWLKIPLDVAKCPDCGAPLVADIQEWYISNEDGSYSITNFIAECENEPDIDGKEYKSWAMAHPSLQNPYIEWLPISMTIQKWLDSQDIVIVDSEHDAKLLKRWMEAAKC